MTLLLLPLVVTLSAAACPAGPASPIGERLGVSLPGAVSTDGGATSWAPGPLALPAPISPPATAAVILPGPCVRVDGAVDRGELVASFHDPASGQPAGLGPAVVTAQLRLGLGGATVELPLRAVTVVREAERTVVSVELAPRPGAGLLESLSGTRLFAFAGDAGADADLLAWAGLLGASWGQVAGADRPALARLWAAAPTVLPFDAVAGLAATPLSPAERAALGPLAPRDGDATHAGAHVYVAGAGARLLVNGREVAGAPGSPPGHPAGEPYTEFVLPVGGDVSLRTDSEWPVVTRVVVDASSIVRIDAPFVSGSSAARTLRTSPGAAWTVCAGAEPVDAVCPRDSANHPSRLFAWADHDGERREVAFLPVAAGDYTLEWGAEELVVRWSPAR